MFGGWQAYIVVHALEHVTCVGYQVCTLTDPAQLIIVVWTSDGGWRWSEDYCTINLVLIQHVLPPCLAYCLPVLSQRNIYFEQ